MSKIIHFLTFIYSFLFQNYASLRSQKISSLKNKNSNVFLSESGVVRLNAQDELRAKKVYIKAKEFLKKHIKSPEKILTYIENHSTKVIGMKNVDKVCLFLNIAPGFVPKQKGFKALFFSICAALFSDSKIDIGFEVPAVFLLGTQDPNIYILSHQFYHWLAYKSNLAGYDEKTQQNFKNIWSFQNSERMKKLSIPEILSLKDAIARDVDALDMVKELAMEFSGQKKCLEKLKMQGSSIV